MFNLSDFRFPVFGKDMFLKVTGVFLIGITLSLVLLNFSGLPSVVIPGGGPAGNPALLKFSSYEDLKSFLNRTTTQMPYYADRGINVPVFSPSSPTPAIYQAGSTLGSVDYSKTNIQVAGVDEADIVKSDGTYIYMVSNNEVLIVKAYPPDSAEVVARIPANGTVAGLFVNGDRLVVFETESGYSIMPLRVGGFYGYYGVDSSIKVYNIGNIMNPVLFRDISVNGSYFDSRMIGDYVYVLAVSPAYLVENDVLLPSIVVDGQVDKVQASSIYYSNASDYSYSFTTVLAVNVQNASEVTHETFLSGYASSIYVSADNIYVASPTYEYGYSEKTVIHRIQISGGEITYKASGEVLGYVLNQYSMDENNGYFRIATTSTGYIPRGIISGGVDQPVPVSQVSVLDQNMKMVGNLTDLAQGERIYSARFMGDRCYLVTFQKIDPLFVISLEDPAQPRVLGSLKIPGYSDYLQPYDETHIIGIGKWTVESKEGDFAWYQGVKISIFDVSDVANPREVVNVTIGDRGTDSPVLSDPNALLFDKSKNLLAIPVTVARIDPSQYPGGIPDNAYGYPVWQGLYVYDIRANSLTLRGGITHIDPSEFLKDSYYYSANYTIERSLYIGNVLYTVSNGMIKMSDLTTLGEINQLKLP